MRSHNKICALLRGRKTRCLEGTLTMEDCFAGAGAASGSNVSVAARCLARRGEEKRGLISGSAHLGGPGAERLRFLAGAIPVAVDSALEGSREGGTAFAGEVVCKLLFDARRAGSAEDGRRDAALEADRGAADEEEEGVLATAGAEGFAGSGGGR